MSHPVIAVIDHWILFSLSQKIPESAISDILFICGF